MLYLGFYGLVHADLTEEKDLSREGPIHKTNYCRTDYVLLYGTGGNQPHHDSSPHADTLLTKRYVLPLRWWAYLQQSALSAHTADASQAVHNDQLAQHSLNDLQVLGVESSSLDQNWTAVHGSQKPSLSLALCWPILLVESWVCARVRTKVAIQTGCASQSTILRYIWAISELYSSSYSKLTNSSQTFAWRGWDWFTSLKGPISVTSACVRMLSFFMVSSKQCSSL